MQNECWTTVVVKRWWWRPWRTTTTVQMTTEVSFSVSRTDDWWCSSGTMKMFVFTLKEKGSLLRGRRVKLRCCHAVVCALCAFCYFPTHCKVSPFQKVLSVCRQQPMSCHNIHVSGGGHFYSNKIAKLWEHAFLILHLLNSCFVSNDVSALFNPFNYNWAVNQ